MQEILTSPEEATIHGYEKHWFCNRCDGRPALPVGTTLQQAKSHAMNVHGCNILLHISRAILGGPGTETWNPDISEDEKRAVNNLTWVPRIDGNFAGFSTSAKVPLETVLREGSITQTDFIAIEKPGLFGYLAAAGRDPNNNWLLYYFRNQVENGQPIIRLIGEAHLH